MFRLLAGSAGLHVHNGPVFYEPEGAPIRRFDAQDAGVTFLAYFLLGPDQEPELSFPAG